MAKTYPTAVQKAYRETIEECTDAEGKVVKSGEEIRDVGRRKIDEVAAEIESGTFSKTYKEGFDKHLIYGTMGKGQKGVVGGHNSEEFKKSNIRCRL